MIALLLATIIGLRSTPSVDRIELNHVYNSSGSPVSQIIIWEPRYALGRHGSHVRQWFLVKPSDVVVSRGIPTIVRFRDRDGIGRVVSARVYRETHTAYDPELEDRKIVVESERRKAIE